MIRARGSVVVALCVSLYAGVEYLGAQQAPSTSTDGANAKIWVGRHQEIEEYLRTAECVTAETLRFGLPGSLRCTLPPGGPVARMHWKLRPPGFNRGFWVSYKAEVAAYELDKLLQLDMLPPTVEREFKGVRGSMILWVEKLVDWKYPDAPPDSMKNDWDRQLARMTMFDDLIGNQDRNVNNMVRDARWNLILLDHDTTFRAGSELPSPLTRIDASLWDRIQKLTRQQLDDRLRPWLDDNEIAGILSRRERMRTEIDRLIAARGVAAVVLK
jgi:hypothetical protein